MSDATTNEQKLQEIGRNAYASIVEMVAALQCDYDRLEELREQRDGWEPDDEPTEDSAATWAEANPEDAEELKELEDAAGDCSDADDARTRIEEDPLSIEVRSGWVSIGDEMTAEEFCILLTTGGPAVRIVGELANNGDPCRAWLEVQDWFQPWTRYFDADQDTLLTYAQCFCFES